MDSLKFILNQKNENAGASQKINFKKIEDSLVEIIKKRILSNNIKMIHQKLLFYHNLLLNYLT